MSDTELLKATILFAGDSGDGIQLTGTEFSHTAALFGNDLNTFPDFPAEIRAPIGTVAGVSGFKINFGSIPIYTPGGKADVLVVMNAAALKKNLGQLKSTGFIIANEGGFDKRNLQLAGFADGDDPLGDAKAKYRVLSMDISKLTRDALKDSTLSTKERDRSKNMFVLGFVYWLYHRSLDHTIQILTSKFASKPDILDANLKVLKAGYHFGETVEAQIPRYNVKKAELPSGHYRNIVGNQAAAIALIAASKKSGLPLYFAGYPITPASDILHELSRQKHFGIKTFQAEDEIAAIAAAIGASFAGQLGVTASSGPGISLKGEGMGLAVMLELPLIVLNIQRGGPSTGLPTKTEQSDLLQAIYGRHGEAPMPVLAAHSPKDVFDTVFEATKLSIEYMTPVMVLSDGAIANGAEPWMFPSAADLPEIIPQIALASDRAYLPYERDERLVRKWAYPGMKGFEHRVGGLEKEDKTGNVSYDPLNHEKMVGLRQAKVDGMVKSFAPLILEEGDDQGDVLLLGWGSTFGSIKVATQRLIEAGHRVSHLHLRHVYPFPGDLEEVMSKFNHVIVPELNGGQLVKLVREKYLIPAQSLTKMQGLPFLADEIVETVETHLKKSKS